MEDESEAPDKRPCSEVLADESRGQLRFRRGQIVRHPLRFIKIVSPFLTSHHPFCSEYEHHTFRLRGRVWCIGCFFNTLFFVLSITTLFGIWIINQGSFDRFLLFWTGVIGAVLYLPVSLLNKSENRGVKVFSKFVLSSSFALVCWSILLADGLFSPGIEYKLFLIVFLYLAVVSMLSTKRIIELGKTCEVCDYKMRWSKCPGFHDILCDLLDESFLFPEDKNTETPVTSQ
ncbi:MAG: hypothetical protein RTU30_00130 [Candidatus Thorarchaeota archaeon]